MSELQHFREPLRDNTEGSERYTNGYHMPNGYYRVKERPKRKLSVPLKISLILVGLLVLGLIVLIAMHFCKFAVAATDAADAAKAGNALPDANNLDAVPSSPADASPCPAVVPPPPLTNNSGIETKQEIKVNDAADLDTLRLPTDLQPQAYSIHILPNFKNKRTTSGDVTIRFTCVNETYQIVLNAKDLDVDENSLEVYSEPNKSNIPIDESDYNEQSETFIIRLKEKLISPTEYTLFMKFTGDIQDTPRGFYRSPLSESESDSFMVNTLFSPTEARSVYPCFDEPSFKARFTFSIARPSAFTTLSNMKVNHSERISNLTDFYWDHFDETPPMSTYFTAFMISQYRPLNTIQSHTNVSFTSYSMSKDISHMTYILRLAADIVQNMETTFKIKYPLPKLDIVAIPDQMFDAMENWGLIIFRRNIAFVDESTTPSKKQDTALILAHEIAHQWFGNLVTPKWWDNLWLKEGFATYFAYQIIDKMFPAWNIQGKFQLEVLHQTFQVDALECTSAISKSIVQPSYKMFNDISYNKGASLIRMMSFFLEKDIMEESIVSYLQEYAYGNADQDNLWDTIMKRKPQFNFEVLDIKTIMDSWTTQAGYPIVNIVRDYKSGSAIITQERFLLNERKDNLTRWRIPLSYTTELENNFEDVSPKIWLNESQTLITHLPKGRLWILANLNQTGLFHVNYDTPNWKLLIDAFVNFPQQIKAQLISDSLHLARGSKLPYDITLSLTLQLTKEIGYLPWKAVSSSLYYLDDLLKNMPGYGDYRVYVLAMVRRAYTYIAKNADLALEFENNIDKQTHMENIISIACHFESPYCVTKAVQLYDEWMSTGNNTIPEAIRQVTYCTAIKKEGRKEWEYALYVLRNTTDKIEQKRRLYALGCTKETWLLTRSLNFILPKNEVTLSLEEILVIFESVAKNNLGHQIAMNFIRYQWPYLLERFGTPSVIIDKMISNIVGLINSPHQVDELKNLIKSIEEKTNANSLSLKQSLERAENNIIWMKKNYMHFAYLVYSARKMYDLNGE